MLNSHTAAPAAAVAQPVGSAGVAAGVAVANGVIMCDAVRAALSANCSVCILNFSFNLATYKTTYTSQLHVTLPALN